MDPVGLVLVIVLVLFVIGALPAWQYSRGWGYGPSGGVALLLVVLVVFLLWGRV